MQVAIACHLPHALPTGPDPPEPLKAELGEFRRMFQREKRETAGQFARPDDPRGTILGLKREKNVMAQQRSDLRRETVELKPPLLPSGLRRERRVLFPFIERGVNPERAASREGPGAGEPAGAEASRPGPGPG